MWVNSPVGEQSKVHHCIGVQQVENGEMLNGELFTWSYFTKKFVQCDTISVTCFFVFFLILSKTGDDNEICASVCFFLPTIHNGEFPLYCLSCVLLYQICVIAMESFCFLEVPKFVLHDFWKSYCSQAATRSASTRLLRLAVVRTQTSW